MSKPPKRFPAGTPIRVFKLAKVTTEKRVGLTDRRVAERRKGNRRISVTYAGSLSFRPITETDLDRPTNNPTGRRIPLRKMVEKTRELFELEVSRLQYNAKLNRAAAIEFVLRPKRRNDYYTDNGLFIRTSY